MKLVGEGHTNNQIAKILNITVRTVETHRQLPCRSSTSRPLRVWSATPFALASSSLDAKRNIHRVACPS